MTRRARRTVGALVAIFAALFVGRSIVAIVAEHWWAETISPAAATFVSEWQLIGVALDAGAVTVASLWFVMQALLVARAIASVQVTQRVGDLQLRQMVPLRWLVVAAIATGVLLGLVAGAGAHDWRGPLALAWQGVRFGVTDPILHKDLGVFVATLPAWDLFVQFATLLAGLGLAFCLALYAGIGALRREGRSLNVHPDARRHLGLLAGVTALAVSAGFWLVPYHLALSQGGNLPGPAATARIHAALASAGVALATAVFSVVWAWRGRHGVLLAGWAVLGIAAFGEHFVVPVFEPADPPPDRAALARDFDARAWGLRLVPANPASDTVPAVTALWDEVTLRRLISVDGGVLEGASPTTRPAASGASSWLVASTPADGPVRFDILAVVDGTTSAQGGDSLLIPAGPGRSRTVWRGATPPRVLPSSAAWRSVTGGVDVGNFLRRVDLAWARQEPGMLGRTVGPGIDWHLDPSERAASILPMFTWLPPDIAIVDDRPVWLVPGMVFHDAFPLATTIRWRNQPIAGATPAVVGVIDVVTGDTRFYLDPAAGPVARAWAAMIGSLIGPSSALPRQALSTLAYSPEWLEMQAAVLATSRWTGIDVPLLPAPMVPVWIAPGQPGRQIALEDAGRSTTRQVLTAWRAGGAPRLRVQTLDPESGPAPGHLELHRRLSADPNAVHLIDSVTASGDSVSWRGTRWGTGRLGPVAWQPLFVLPRRRPPSLLWIGAAVADHTGGGRTPLAAWRDVTLAGSDSAVAGPVDAVTLQQARLWMERADSAFRRGDLTAFGRAFEQLRNTLRPHR